MKQNIKRCRTCEEVKPLSEFYANPTARDRKTSACKVCDKERLRQRARRITESEKPDIRERECPRCRETKGSADFGKNRSRPDGLSFYCKACSREKRVEAMAANPSLREKNRKRLADLYKDQERYLNYRYRSRFGITLDQYEAMLDSQGGGCAICGSRPQEGEPRLAVDHDHDCCPASKKSCGKCVRGLLCGRCNRGIGYFDDRPETLERAATYVAQHKALGVKLN